MGVPVGDLTLRLESRENGASEAFCELGHRLHGILRPKANYDDWPFRLIDPGNDFSQQLLIGRNSCGRHPAIGGYDTFYDLFSQGAYPGD